MATVQPPATEVVTPQRQEQRQFPLVLFLVCIACAFELLYLFLVALSPLAGLHLSPTPLAEQWSWTLFPTAILTTIASPVVNLASAPALSLHVLLGVTLAGLAGVYIGAVIVLRRVYGNNLLARSWLCLLLAGTLIFSLTLLFQPALLSDDVFTALFIGRMQVIYGANPLHTAPLQFPHDPYLAWVLSGLAGPNIYGPLWLRVTAVLAAGSNNPAISLLIFKSFAILVHLLNCVLVWSILRKVAPARCLMGTLLFAWNPLAVIELAGSGHNEGLLNLFLLLATYLYIQGISDGTIRTHRRFPPWLFRLSALFVLGLAISTNLIALLIAPLALWFDVRTENNREKATWQFGWRALIILLPEVLLLLPFWDGASTFFAITSSMDMAHFVHAPVSLLTIPLHFLFGTAARVLHFPQLVSPSVAADMTLRASATFIFALLYIHHFGTVCRAPQRNESHTGSARESTHPTIPGVDVLLRCLSIILFWYMVLVSGWFWPWYFLWMLWIIVLQRMSIFTSAMLLLSCTALFIYPFIGFSRGPIAAYQVTLIFGIPLLYLFAAWYRQRYKERMIPSHDGRS